MVRYSIMREALLPASERVEPGVPGEEVGFGLAAHDDAGDAVAHRDDRRARHVVVVAGERPAVGAGRGHREQVAGRDVAGRYSASTTMSPRLAVLADDANERGRGVATPGRRCAPSSRRRRARCGRCRSCRRRRLT